MAIDFIVALETALTSRPKLCSRALAAASVVSMAAAAARNSRGASAAKVLAVGVGWGISGVLLEL